MSEKKTDAINMSEPHTTASTLRIAVANQECVQTNNNAVYLGGTVAERAELMDESTRRISRAIKPLQNKYSKEPYDRPSARRSRSKFG